MDLHNILARQSLHDSQLSATNDDARREKLCERDRMLFRVNYAVKEKRMRL